MTLDLPDLLVQRAHEWGGAAGRAWLAALPDLVASLAARWHLDVEPPLPSHISFVAPARRGGERTILKIPLAGIEFPYAQAENSAFEATALRHWAGLGAIRLLEHDAGSGAMLLERCEPGTRLADAATPEEADDVAVHLLEQLWRPAPVGAVLPTTAELAANWARTATERYGAAAGPFELDLLDETLEILRRFSIDRPAATVLHGDFHHNNVLSSGRGWLAIDPLPLVGDREYDAVMFLILRMSRADDPERTWSRDIDGFCGRLGLDPRSVKEWLLVRHVSDALAFLSHGGDRRVLDARREDLWSARLVRSML